MSDEGQGYGGYASPVPSSTVPDQPDKHGLPPFSSFQDQEPSASRLLDISSWDYYSTDGRIERDGFPILVPQYRPWESKDELNKLPSFQSQFTTFSQDANGETVSLTTLTPAVPSELPSFQTLGPMHQGGRGYPLVPAPVQAREIPGVQQQLLDERHIHLFQGPQQYYQPQQQATLLTVVKTEPLIVTQLDPQPYSGLKLDPLDSRKKERRKVRASSLESSAESDGVSSVESSGQVAAISTTSGFKSSPLVHPGPLSHDDCMDISDKPVKKKRKRCGECIGCQRKDNCGDCAPCRNDKSHQICKMRRCEKLTDKKHLLYMNHEFSRGERGRGRGKGRGSAAYRKSTRAAAASSNYQINGGASDSSNLMNSLSSDHSVKSESKHENTASINQQQPNLPPMSGGVMYGAGNGAVGAVTPSTEQAYQPPTRFPNTVWHQANNPDPNTIGAWTPQGQFIQQVPTHQLEDIRYSQYGISPYPPQATTVTYQSTSGFIQQNGIYTNTSAQNVGTAPSPQGNMASQASMPTAQRATPNHMNGNVEYSVEQSPRPADPYINGNYSHNNQEVVGGSAPPSRCGSAQMEGASEGGGKYTNPPTPTTPQSNQQTQQNGSQQSAQQSGAQQQQGNAMPGYPPHPPQSVQQSLHNSSGYPGQSNNSIQNGMLGEVKEQNQKGGSNEEMWNGNVKRKEGEWTNEREGPWSSEGTRDSNRETPGRPPDPPIWEQQWNNQDWNRQQPAKESSPVKEERNKAWERQWNGQNNEWNGHSKDNSPVKNEKNSQWEQQWNGQSGEWNETSKDDSPNKEEGNRHWERQWNGQAPEWNGQSKGSNDGSQQQWQTEHPWNQDKKDSDRNQLNNRLKTMILNKQQFQEGRQSNEIRQSIYQQDQNTYKNGGSSSNNSENFLLYGHHPQELASEGGGAGAMDSSKKFSALQNSNHAETNGWVPKEQCFDNRGLDIKPNINFKATKIKEETWNHCTQTDQYCNQDNKQVLQKDLYFGMSNQCVGTNNTSPTFPPTLYQNEYKTKEAEVQSDNSDAFKIPESGNFSSRNVYTSNSTNSLFNKDTNHLKSPLPSPLNNFQIKQEEMLSKVKLENDKGTETDDIGAKSSSGVNSKEFTDYIDKLKNNVKTEIPVCSCLSGDVGVTEPEPGSYYTHLGAAPSLLELRTSTEQRTGLIGNAIRIEKIVYTGKEGKTTSGCPLAKWIIRRSNLDEKLLMVVKHRPGHTCQTAWIVVVIVAWEGVPRNDADILYTMLSYKLNKFGLTTSRRCATNEPRTCACQGLDPQSCGASFSFGCSWSMYYNGCKFARSKHVRKFRLTVKTEEKEVEEKMQKLATVLGPLYRVLAPESYRNQVQFESEAAECRLGSTPGQPFSGVTACIDFCAHAHKDIHNMNNGCTVVVTLNKHRTLEKPEDEQLHVLPLYVIDETDEYGDEAAQKQKVKTGAIEHLTKFPCEVRVRSVPLTPCRRRKKRKDETDLKAKRPNIMPPTNPVKTENQWSNCLPSSQLQIPQVTSTVGDSRSWSPYTVPVTNWTSDRRTPLPPWSSVHTSWNRSITSPQHASFHSTHYQGSWSSMNLNEGLPLDDQVKMDPDSTTLSPSLLKGVSPMQWPNGIKREIIEPDYTGKTQLNNSTHFQDSMLNNKSLKIKEEIPNYYNNCATNNTSPNSNVNKVANNCVNPMSINFLSSNESKKSPMATLPSSKSPGTPSSHLFKSELPPIGDNSKHVNDSSLPPSDNFKTPQVPKQKGFSQNEPIAVTVKSERRNSCETPNTGCNIGQNQKKTESLPVNGFDSTYSYQNFQNHLSPSYVNFSHSYRMNNAYQSSNYLSQASLHSHLSSSYAKSDDQSKMFYSQMDLNKSVNHQSAHFYPHSQGLGIGNQFLPWNAYGPTPYLPPSPKPEPIGHVSSIIDNAECFQDSQMGGVAIALGHGSVLFECAKHELHATTALRRPDRHHPTRISLVFYQHRNLNKPNHGADHWEEKMRLRKEQPPTPDPVTIPSTETQFSFPTGQFSVNSAQVPLGNNQFLPETQFPVNSGQYPTRPYSVQTSQFNSSESQYHQPQTPFPHNSWPTLFPSLHPYPVPLSIYKGNT